MGRLHAGSAELETSRVEPSQDGGVYQLQPSPPHNTENGSLSIALCFSRVQDSFEGGRKSQNPINSSW